MVCVLWPSLCRSQAKQILSNRFRRKLNEEIVSRLQQNNVVLYHLWSRPGGWPLRRQQVQAGHQWTHSRVSTDSMKESSSTQKMFLSVWVSACHIIFQYVVGFTLWLVSVCDKEFAHVRWTLYILYLCMHKVNVCAIQVVCQFLAELSPFVFVSQRGRKPTIRMSPGYI